MWRMRTIGAVTLAVGCSGLVPGVAWASGSVHTTSARHVASKPKKTAAVVIETESTKYGTILENASGRTLSETNGNCTSSACLAVWPPLIAPSRSSYGKGVQKKLVGDVVLTGGRRQLTYDGHRLFSFAKDTKAHETNGENIHSPWGTWEVLGASNGKLVTKAVTAKKTASSGY